MADFVDVPTLIRAPNVISTWGLNSLGGGGFSATPASAAWPSGNRAILTPFRIDEPVLVKQLFVVNGSTASGNLDAGIYNKDGVRLVSKGTTAQSGTTTAQLLDITDTQIGPGLFYLAIAMDGTTGTNLRLAPAQVAFCKALGLGEAATSFVLPATLTIATVSSAYIPGGGLILASTL